MSQENVTMVSGFPSRWNAGDRTIRPEEVDPDVAVESPLSSVAGRPYRGYAGVEEWFRDLDEQFVEWQVRFDDVREVESTVVAIGAVRLRGRGSDVGFDQPMSWIVDFGADGRVTRLRTYLGTDAALKAVGLEG